MSCPYSLLVLAFPTTLLPCAKGRHWALYDALAIHQAAEYQGRLYFTSLTLYAN